ncbi:hypothetical protein JW758_00485 [Candidatus Peregrinibacteria bacterium]|nr:hypothetical protein [Candidatus Peregrinibacteria bacterium]
MKECEQCKRSFDIYPDEIEFLEKMKFTYGDKKYTMPEPVLCSECRSQGRVAHRNEQFLYQRKSDLSGKQMVTLYSNKPAWGEPYKVYTQEEWNGDGWDPLDYGRDFDFSRPFFEQFAELHKAVPRLSLMQVGNENSPYTTGTGYCNNCHLINSSEYCEDCYYGKLLQKCKTSIDCSYLYDSELCYQCFNVYDSYNCKYLSYSTNCSDCWFSENLSGCKNCFLCTNLKNKEYYFMNEPLDKNEYKKRIGEFIGSYRNFQKASEILDKMRRERIHKYANITNSENSTGDFILNSKNCVDCYDVNDSEDCRNVIVGVEMKDVYDSSNMYVKIELNYQTLGTIDTYNMAYTLYGFHSQNILYCEQIFHSKDLFGCVGLKRKQYCVFNKQYTKEQYEELVPRIIEHMKKTGEWGMFFPVKFSPHGYNESLANEYYPLSKQEVLKRGWNWHEDEEAAVYQGADYQIPDNIKDVPDEITQKILKCEASGKFYKIIPQELKFYRNGGIPIPRRCPDQRHVDRMELRNPREVYKRECAKCLKNIKSTYDPDRPEKVYCEECYLKEVY